MHIFRSTSDRESSPLLNFFWFLLFLPAALILYLLWQEKLPWLGEPAGGRQPRNLTGEPPSARPRAEKVPAHKEAVPASPSRAAEERRAPDEKRQKDTSKAEHQGSPRRGQGDELEVVEGIGPKTATLLRNAGITTFRELADTGVDRLNEILREGGIRMNPPDTWPEQARFAAEGDWDGLDQLKRSLRAGRQDKA